MVDVDETRERPAAWTVGAAGGRGRRPMRPIRLHYPDDESARGLATQYLWGRDLLIAPVLEPGATSREVYLPEGKIILAATLGLDHRSIQCILRSALRVIHTEGAILAGCARP